MLSLFFWTLTISAAWSQQEGLSDIRFYGDVLLNASSEDHRSRANDELLVKVKDLLTSQDDPWSMLSDVPWISTQFDSIGGWTLVTWQLRYDKENSKSYGFLRRMDGTVFDLHDKWPTGGYEGTCTASTWYGARYYASHHFMNEGRDMWLLIGYKEVDLQERQRVADILTFDEDGVPQFGLPIFRDTTNGSTQSRIAVAYSPMARVQMRFDEELDCLIYDHVVQLPNGIRAGDATFMGYKRGDAAWTKVHRFFTTTVEEAPSARDELDDEQRPRKRSR